MSAPLTTLSIQYHIDRASYGGFCNDSEVSAMLSQIYSQDIRAISIQIATQAQSKYLNYVVITTKMSGLHARNYILPAIKLGAPIAPELEKKLILILAEIP